MGRPGLEPGTIRLKAEYSTIELATRNRCLLGNVYYYNTSHQNVKGFFKRKLLSVGQAFPEWLLVPGESAAHQC